MVTEDYQVIDLMFWFALGVRYEKGTTHPIRQAWQRAIEHDVVWEKYIAHHSKERQVCKIMFEHGLRVAQANQIDSLFFSEADWEAKAKAEKESRNDI